MHTCRLETRHLATAQKTRI